MSHKYVKTLFTEEVKEVQQEYGVREGAIRLENAAMERAFISEKEMVFLAERDSFYMATVASNGWPYVQHRGGPTGFLKYLGENKIGFADFRGNDQYMSVGNLRGSDKISIILMDYPNRRRLKIIGHCSVVKFSEHPELARWFDTDEQYGYDGERAMIIDVHSFDWNCPQHITPRFSQAQIEAILHEHPDFSKANYTLPTVQEVEQLGDDFIPVELVASVKKATETTEFIFKPIDDIEITPEAGAHIDIAVRGHNNLVKANSYSLTNGPDDTQTINIAVLKETDGQCGSFFMHATPSPGDILYLRLPQNDFPLNFDAAHSVLIAGGIGITPILSMAKALRHKGKPFEFHYAARTPLRMAFKEEVAALADEAAYFYFSEQEPVSMLDLNALLEAPTQGTHVYVCGPKGLIQAVVDIAAEKRWPKDQIHFEVFANKAHSSESNEAFEVDLVRSGKRVTVEANETLLDVLLEESLPIPHSCLRGECGTCKVPVVGGEIDHKDIVLDKFEKEAGDVMCSCVSRSKDGVLKLDL